MRQAPAPRRRPSATVVELTLGGVLLVLFAWAVGSVVAVPAPLGHDESAYAAQARHWLAGTPDSTWFPHRAPGLAVLGMGVQLVTDAESALRLVGLALGLVAVAGVWWLARSVVAPAADLGHGDAGDPPGSVAAAVAGVAGVVAVVTAAPILSAGSWFLTDLPAAALVVVTAGILWHGFETRERPGWALVAAAPAAAGAFYLRFGAALILGLVFVTAVALWWPKLRRDPAPSAAAGGLLALLLVPHMVSAVRAFGTPWGQVLHTGAVVSEVMEEAGLPTYLRAFPFDLAGPVAGAMMALGVLGAVGGLLAAVARGRWGAQERGWVLLVGPALVYAVVIGLRAAPDLRFLFPSILLLAAAGAVGLGRALLWATGTAGDRWARAGLAVAVALAGFALPLVVDARTDARDRRAAFADSQETVRLVAAEVAARSGDACMVVTTYTPQLLWYSRCEAWGFDRVSPADLAEAGGDRWVVVFEDGKRQPEGAELDAYLDLAPGGPHVQVDGPGPDLARAEAWHVAPDA